MKTQQSFSILIWANKSKADQNGLLPLYARVTVNGKRAEISLKKKVKPTTWNVQSGTMKGSTEEVRQVNKNIGDVRNQLWQIYADKRSLGQYISAEEIKEVFLGSESSHRSLLEVFDEHNKQVAELVGKQIVKATLVKYETIRSKVSEYIIFKFNKKDILLDKLEYSFITGFEHYLKANQSISHNVVMSYIKRVKRIVNIAVDNKWIAVNPFKKFVCTTKKTNRTELEESELGILQKKEFAVSRLEEVRDCYLFSCYTGYAFVDACKLTRRNIVTGNDGEIWIITDRTKSKIEASVPLLPQAIAIIEKYENHPVCVSENRLLPMKSNQKMNAYLKEIAALCGIEKNLTTHTARHTFATTVTLQNDVPIETVSKMLGHTKITTTQIYARVKRKKISQDMKMLRCRLSATGTND